MSEVFLNTGGSNYKRVQFSEVAGSTVLSLNLGAATSVAAKYSGTAPSSQALSGDMDRLHLKTNLANAFSISGVRFSRGSVEYVSKANGDVQIDLNPSTGLGTTVGALTAGDGEVTLDSWVAGSTPAVSNWRAVAGAPINGPDTPFNTYGVTFRTPTAPLRSGSLTILGSMQDETTFNVTADADGIINTTRIKGRVNYQTGVVVLVGVTPTAPAGQDETDISFLNIPGLATAYIDLIRQETLRFNAVAYTYLPLDANLLGINPERLPSDGRVPIFRAGGAVVVGNMQETAAAMVADAQVVDLGRTRLSRVRVIGDDGLVIHAGYTADLEAGTVTFTDVSGYSQPVTIQHRIEDMAGLQDAQIDGTLVMLRPLTHVFPAEGSYVSSAFVVGDMKARTSLVFDQATWDGTSFLDALSGAAATGTYNDAANPVAVTNAGAITQRWVLRFTSTTAFQIIGENVGVIGTGTISTETAPDNPNSSEPYFRLAAEGWGSGWSVGNILRINTVGAMAPLWLARTIKQGPTADDDYAFTLLVRGDVDNPLP
jgi:hypothetical protein